MEEKISIIIPIYNSSKYLSKCLESVINQTYKNIEILLLNDGSKDNSMEICEYYSNKDKRIRIFNNSNKGVSYTRNYGIDQSTGVYITFVDSDDIIIENFIEILYKSLKKFNEDCSICKMSKKINKIKNNLKPPKVYNKDKIFKNLFGEFGGFLCNKMYKKNIIKNNNIYLNEKIGMSEDIIFNLDYFKYCNKVVFNYDEEYFYRFNPNSVTNDLFNKKWFTLLDTYIIILNKFEFKKNDIYKVIIYNINILLAETKYRLKINKIDSNVFNKKIEILEKHKNDVKFTLLERFKMFVFNNFMKYIVLYRKFIYNIKLR